jgi:hypothetical protein
MRLSRSPGSDGRGQGGRIEHWLIVRVLKNYRGVRLYDHGGDVLASEAERKKLWIDLWQLI